MFEFIFNKSKMIPIDIRTKVHNLTVELGVQKQINSQLIKNQSFLEERIMKLEKKFILSKIE
jgi:hypothetical protein